MDSSGTVRCRRFCVHADSLRVGGVFLFLSDLSRPPRVLAGLPLMCSVSPALSLSHRVSAGGGGGWMGAWPAVHFIQACVSECRPEFAGSFDDPVGDSTGTDDRLG